MNKDKITPENYKGYCELLKSKYVTDEQYDKYLTKMFKSGIIPGILFVVSVIFHVPDVLILLSILNFLVVPTAVTAKTIIDDTKKTKAELAEKYPDININMSLSRLNSMFKEAGIKNIEASSLEYENYVKCEEIKQEVINDWKKSPLEVEPSISADELEKAKVKVKTMSKRGM